MRKETAEQKAIRIFNFYKKDGETELKKWHN